MQNATNIIDYFSNSIEKIKSTVVVAKNLQSIDKQELLKYSLLQCTHALQYSENIYNINSHLELLFQIIELLNEENRLREIKNIPQIIHAIKDDWMRASSLYKLIPYLDNKDRRKTLKEAIQSTMKIEHLGRRADYLTTLALHSKGLVKYILLKQALKVISHDGWRAKTLVKLASLTEGYKQEKFLKEAIKIISTDSNSLSNSTRALVLRDIANYVGEESKQNLLNFALDSAANDEYFDALCAGTYKELLPNLQNFSELQMGCLNLTLSLPRKNNDRLAIISELTSQNNSLLSYALWNEWLNSATEKQTRSHVLNCIPDLAQAAVQLTGNPKQAEEIAQAVMDVGEWWP